VAGSSRTMSRTGPRRRRSSCAADSAPSVRAADVVAADAVTITCISGSVARGPNRLLRGSKHRRARARYRRCIRGRGRDRSITRIGCSFLARTGILRCSASFASLDPEQKKAHRAITLGEVARMYQTPSDRHVAAPAYPVRPARGAVRPMVRNTTAATVGRRPHDTRPTQSPGVPAERRRPIRSLRGWTRPQQTSREPRCRPHAPPNGSGS